MRNALTKSLGTSNPHNVVHATVATLKGLKSPEQFASKRNMQTDDLGYQRRGGGLTGGPKRRSLAPPPPPAKGEGGAA